MASWLSAAAAAVGVDPDSIDTKAVSGVLSAVSKTVTEAKDSVLATPRIEVLIRDATNDDQCPPTNSVKQEIAQASYYYAEFPIIMEWIWNRLSEPPHNWRRIYKALLVIDYLLKNGSEQVEKDVKNHGRMIERLQRFRHLDNTDRDVGANVRERAKQVLALLRDRDLLAEERKKARSNKGKYMESMSSDSYYRGKSSHGGARYGGGGGRSTYGGGGGYDGGGGYGGGPSRSSSGGGSRGYDYDSRSSSRYDDRSSSRRDRYSSDRDYHSSRPRDDGYGDREDSSSRYQPRSDPPTEPKAQHKEEVAAVSSGIGLIDFGEPSTPKPTTTTTTTTTPNLFGGDHSTTAAAPPPVDDFFNPRGASTTTAPPPSGGGSASPWGVVGGVGVASTPTTPAVNLSQSAMGSGNAGSLLTPAEEDWGDVVGFDPKEAEKKNDLWNKHEGLINLGGLGSPKGASASGGASGLKQPIGAMPTANRAPTMGGGIGTMPTTIMGGGMGTMPTTTTMGGVQGVSPYAAGGGAPGGYTAPMVGAIPPHGYPSGGSTGMLGAGGMPGVGAAPLGGVRGAAPPAGGYMHHGTSGGGSLI